MINNYMKEYKPYCYLIGWQKLNIWYYGSEYGAKSKIANPENLWTSYFTSSKYVKEFTQKHGKPDIIKIRKIFKTDIDAIYWEYRVLKRLKVRSNKNWLNKNEGKAPVGKPWTEERKIQRSKMVSGNKNPMFGRQHRAETKLLISAKSSKKGTENGMYNKKHTAESKNKMSENHHILKTMLGKLHTEESKRRMSISHSPKTFKYSHPEHGIISATMRQMTSLFPELKLSGLKALSSNRLKTYKGWCIDITQIF